MKAFSDCKVLVRTVYPNPSLISSSSASKITSSGFTIPNAPPRPKSMKSPPKLCAISLNSPSGSIATILHPFLMWVLSISFAAVDLPLPDVPKIIMLALFRLNSFFVWYKNWLNKTTPPEKSTPNNVLDPGSLMLSNTNGYIAAIVGLGIGIPTLSSTSCLGNIGIIDFRTFSCSNIIGIPLMPIASR